MTTEVKALADTVSFLFSEDHDNEKEQRGDLTDSETGSDSFAGDTTDDDDDDDGSLEVETAGKADLAKVAIAACVLDKDKSNSGTAKHSGGDWRSREEASSSAIEQRSSGLLAGFNIGSLYGGTSCEGRTLEQDQRSKREMLLKTNSFTVLEPKKDELGSKSDHIPRRPARRMGSVGLELDLNIGNKGHQTKRQNREPHREIPSRSVSGKTRRSPMRSKSGCYPERPVHSGGSRVLPERSRSEKVARRPYGQPSNDRLKKDTAATNQPISAPGSRSSSRRDVTHASTIDLQEKEFEKALNLDSTRADTTRSRSRTPTRPSGSRRQVRRSVDNSEAKEEEDEENMDQEVTHAEWAGRGSPKQQVGRTRSFGQKRDATRERIRRDDSTGGRELTNSIHSTRGNNRPNFGRESSFKRGTRARRNPHDIAAMQYAAAIDLYTKQDDEDDKEEELGKHKDKVEQPEESNEVRSDEEEEQKAERTSFFGLASTAVSAVALTTRVTTTVACKAAKTTVKSTNMAAKVCSKAVTTAASAMNSAALRKTNHGNITATCQQKFPLLESGAGNMDDLESTEFLDVARSCTD